MRLTTRLVGFTALALAAVLLASTGTARADYPDRPISIIVHTKPGGAIDLTARLDLIGTAP